MPKKDAKPRKPTLKSSLVKDLNLKIKEHRRKLRELEKDKRSLQGKRRKLTTTEIIKQLNDGKA